MGLVKQVMKHPRSGVVVLLAGLVLCCRAGEVDQNVVAAGGGPAEAARRAIIAARSAAGRPGVAADPVKAPMAPAPWHIPIDPKLPIEPGKGVGPIRFGARLETIERLLGEPCEEKVEAAPGELLCRYSAQAIDFVLKQGAVSQMRLHRLGRPFKPGSKADYGIYNGHFPDGTGVGMLQTAVEQALGKPQAVRKLSADNPFKTVEIHDYPEFSLEYDQLEPDRLVLGGVVLNAPKAKR
jgi:hypothetical protein